MNSKVVAIAGGSSGIGQALVKFYVNDGATVYALDKDEPSELIGSAIYLHVNLADSKQVQNCIIQITHPVNVLILSIGIMRRGTIFDTSDDEFDLLLDSNLKAPWLLLKYIRSKLATNPTIVQISSGHALNPEADPGIYTLSKKGTVALAELTALTLLDARVKVAYPGPVLTPLLLEGRNEKDRERIAKIAVYPDEIASKISELIDSDKKTLKFIQDNNSYELK